MPQRLSRRSLLAGLVIAPMGGLRALGRGVEPTAQKLIQAAESQIGITRMYDAAYVRIAFPGGDVPIDRGVCTDVIVRAYRQAFGYDLQAKLNADMKADFGAYPKRWGLSRPDSNIDHRRVPNLQVFFARQKAELPKPMSSTGWQPGDLVTMLVPGGRPHIGIVSTTLVAGTERPKIIHNIGLGTQSDDILDALAITGRYRLLSV
jgi:uncharacterized protein